MNGAGKSSIGGRLLRRAGLAWFNSDAFARDLVAETGCDLGTASARAWAEGVRRLDDAIAHRRTFALETTLGGHTLAKKIQAATQTHDVLIWFCGLASPEQHVARVKLRVDHGGHDIPAARIRARYPQALANMIALMPLVAEISVYDNSTDALPGEPVPDPALVLRTRGRAVLWPVKREDLVKTPDWAKPLVEAALRLGSPE